MAKRKSRNVAGGSQQPVACLEPEGNDVSWEGNVGRGQYSPGENSEKPSVMRQETEDSGDLLQGSLGRLGSALLTYSEEPCNGFLLLIAENIEETNAPLVLKASGIVRKNITSGAVRDDEALPRDFVAPDQNSEDSNLDLKIL